MANSVWDLLGYEIFSPRDSRLFFVTMMIWGQTHFLVNLELQFQSFHSLPLSLFSHPNLLIKWFMGSLIIQQALMDLPFSILCIISRNLNTLAKITVTLTSKLQKIVSPNSLSLPLIQCSVFFHFYQVTLRILLYKSFPQRLSQGQRFCLLLWYLNNDHNNLHFITHFKTIILNK